MRINFHLNQQKRAKKLTPGVNNHAVENPSAFNANSKRELHNTATGSIAAEEMKEDTSNVQYVENSQQSSTSMKG